MKVKRHGLTNFYSFNTKFNKATEPLVGDIFQTESTGPVGYIQTRPFVPLQERYYVLRSQLGAVQSEQQIPPPQKNRFDLSGLGEYERILFSCLAWGEYSTYVLTGEMGSGKTTSADYVMEALRRPRSTTCGQCHECSGPILITIDFNKGFNSANSTKIMRSFRLLLYSRLKAELRRIFRRDGLTDRFLKFIQEDKNLNDFSLFDDFAQECETDDWLNETQAGKTNGLFKYISDKSQDVIDQLEMLMLLVAFSKEEARPDSACLALLLDNIDSVTPEAQFELLVEILSLQEFARIKVLVPMRRSTFERLNNHAAYSFGIINHSGPRPVDIVKARIEYYLRVWDDLPQVRVLEPQHAGALRQRLRYIASEFEHKNSVLEKVFWLSGASLRQSLFMFERVVNNSVIEYDKDPHYRDEVLRAILHGSSPDQEISSSDRFVANILIDPGSGEFSLICIRILQFVHEFAELPNYRNVRNLLATILAVNPRWTSKVVQKALNYLLHIKRPLLWVDGKSSYDSPTQMIDCNDRIYITEAGYCYLTRLLLDLEYFQEASIGVEWKKSSNLPEFVNYTSLLDRFALLRLCLRAVMLQDFEETLRFRRWIGKREDFPDVRIRMISNRILAALGETILMILKPRGENVNELKSWLSMIIEGFNNEARATGRESQSLDKLRRRYESAVTKGAISPADPKRGAAQMQ